MRFAVIEGGREWTEPKGTIRPVLSQEVSVEDVEAEARRRLKAIKLDEWRTREFITGRQMPDEVRHLALQINYAAKALSRLSPIPDDYHSDLYWPQVWPL